MWLLCIWAGALSSLLLSPQSQIWDVWADQLVHLTCRGSQAQIGPSHFIYYLECEGCQSIRQPATMIPTPRASQICILVTRFTSKPHHQLILPACSYLESVQESSDLIAIHTFHTQSIQIQHIKYKQQQVTKLFFLALSFLEQPQAFRFRNFR